jgi:ribose transport system permease protein
MEAKQQNRFVAYIKGPGQQNTIAVTVLIFLYLFFGAMGKNFTSTDTLISIFDSSYYMMLLATGMTFVIISGGIDLSVGTVMVGSALVGGVAYVDWRLPIAICLSVVVLTGIVFGLINGILIGKLGLPPFIATLGTQFMSMGLCSVISKVQSKSYPRLTSPDGWFKEVFAMTKGGFPTGIIWVVAVFLMGLALLKVTKLGNYTYAIGSNEEAVRLSGIKTSNWKVLIYTLAGFCSGMAGIFFAAKTTSITPQAGGGEEMYAIAACVIGGISLSGGIGSITGTIIGVLVINVLKTGLMSMSIPVQWQNFLIGVVVIAAVLVDIVRGKRQQKA